MDTAAAGGPLGSLAVWMLYGGGAVGLLAILGVLAWRRLRGLPGHTEIFPNRSVPAGLILLVSCFCLLFPFLAWVPTWLFKVRRANGTTWSVPWKVVYMLAPIFPVVTVVFVFRELGYREPPFGLSLLIPVTVLLVVGIDAVLHRTASKTASGTPRRPAGS